VVDHPSHRVRVTTAPAVVTGAVILAELLRRLDDVPSRRPVAARVLQLTRDDVSSSAQVGAAIGADPALAARLLRLANSAFYGLSGRIGSPALAVTIVGFTTVSSLAVTAAAGVDDPERLPPGFWERSAAAAIAAGTLAPRFGLDPSETFCLGLLATIGQALVHQVDPSYRLVCAQRPTRAELLAAEVARYGTSQVEVTARALQAWRFPTRMAQTVQALGDTADDVLLTADPVSRSSSCLRVAIELAERVTHERHEPTPVETLSAGRVRERQVDDVVAAIESGASDLARAVTC
jgi:HD-like signal output (HDOD) protein